MSYRLTPSQRIRHRKDFKTIFNFGKKWKGSFLSIWVSKQPQQKKAALAIMVSRKTAAKAVERNLWKRRIREAFRKMQSALLPETAVLIQAQKGGKVPVLREISEELGELLRKSGFKK